MHLLLALLLAGPSSATPRVALAAFDAARVDTVADTTWYITNRARRAGRMTRTTTDSLEFGYVVTRFLEGRGETDSERLLGRSRAQRGDSVRLTREEFVQRVAAADARAAARGDGAVLYVHGYATSFARGVAQSAETAHRAGYAGPFILFAWPAHTALATWPTPKMLISHAYRDDSVAAARSAAAFRAAVMVVREAVRPGALTVVGHSMGAQLVAEALSAPGPEHDALAAQPLRAIAFFAADIGAIWFRDSVAPAIAPLAARRVVYASSADKMLALSRLVNHAPRLGQVGTARFLRDAGVEVVDVSRATRARGSWTTKLIDVHHAMRTSGAALLDLFDDVVRGQPATCRSSTGLADRDAAGVWHLGKTATPHSPACVPTIE
ncbi:MAG: alpha/beta hydrolase [Gemmatimonadetes bacterium]|nr:alpha/beta hydrolase [Gemmatimonadota bacterium]